MQFRDLKKQYEKLKPEIDNAVLEVMSDCNFINGKQVQDLESQLAEYVGVKHCITCANGTDALTMAIMTWDIGQGDAVFVPDFTFFSSGEVVSYAGATPVFVDVDKSTFNLDSNSLENAVKSVFEEGRLVPRAIIAVDLFGLPADYSKIKDIANRYNLHVLEDGAQGFGGNINGRMACSFGDISTTSFFPAKPLGCYGDGGAVFTDNDETDRSLRSIRVHGKGDDKYDNIRVGLNSRLDTLQAAILSVKLKAFKDYELEAVNKVAEQYSKGLRDCCITPRIPKGYYSSWAQYTIRLQNRKIRDNLQIKLKEKKIPTTIYYAKPMHKQQAFRGVNFNQNCENTEELTQTVLSLPIHPYMEKEDIEHIISEIQ